MASIPVSACIPNRPAQKARVYRLQPPPPAPRATPASHRHPPRAAHAAPVPPRSGSASGGGSRCPPRRARSSRPRLNTNAASASDACSAGRLSAGSAIRSHRRHGGARALPVGSQPRAESLLVELRRTRVELAQGHCRAHRTEALAHGKVAVAQQRAREVQRRRQAGAAQHAHLPPGRTSGISSRGCNLTPCSLPRRASSAR